MRSHRARLAVWERFAGLETSALIEVGLNEHYWHYFSEVCEITGHVTIPVRVLFPLGCRLLWGGSRASAGISWNRKAKSLQSRCFKSAQNIWEGFVRHTLERLGRRAGGWAPSILPASGRYGVLGRPVPRALFGEKGPVWLLPGRSAGLIIGGGSGRIMCVERSFISAAARREAVIDTMSPANVCSTYWCF